MKQLVKNIFKVKLTTETQITRRNTEPILRVSPCSQCLRVKEYLQSEKFIIEITLLILNCNNLSFNQNHQIKFKCY